MPLYLPKFRKVFANLQIVLKNLRKSSGNLCKFSGDLRKHSGILSSCAIFGRLGVNFQCHLNTSDDHQQSSSFVAPTSEIFALTNENSATVFQIISIAYEIRGLCVVKLLLLFLPIIYSLSWNIFVQITSVVLIRNGSNNNSITACVEKLTCCR